MGEICLFRVIFADICSKSGSFGACWRQPRDVVNLFRRSVVAPDRTDRVDKSLFRLGLDWLKHVLKRGLPFDVYFFFQPAQLGGNVR